MARWVKGEQTVQFLVDRDRLESFEAEDLAVLAEAPDRAGTAAG